MQRKVKGELMDVVLNSRKYDLETRKRALKILTADQRVSETAQDFLKSLEGK